MKEAQMKRFIIGFAFSALASSASARDNQYEIKTDAYGSSIGGSTEIEMRKKYDDDPSNKYRRAMRTHKTKSLPCH